jgi:hypothetical protein
MTTVLEARNKTLIQFSGQIAFFAFFLSITIEHQYITEAMHNLRPFLHTVWKMSTLRWATLNEINDFYGLVQGWANFFVGGPNEKK